MKKKIVISEKDNIGAVTENGKVTEFFVHKGDVLLGDVYLSKVDNILPSIEAAFVDVGLDKMGFIHTNDIMGKGTLKEKVKPKQKLIVQVVKEPTGHKGPRMTTALSLPGRFLVLLPDEKGINVSKKIVSQKERARLKSIVSLLKPTGVGIIVRTEAEGQAESEIQEDIEMLLEKWSSIITAADTSEPPCLLHRDQDLLYRTIREACSEDVEEIIVDTPFSLHRATQLLQHWNMLSKIKVTLHKGTEPLLTVTGVSKEIQSALNTKVNLPLGGYLFIQQTEALTVIDVNSGKFVSSSSQAETILKTNLQASEEIARQLKLRNIGGMIIVDFIDMSTRIDKLKVLEHFELALSSDKAKPQIGQLSDLGLVELTRHRQGQSLAEVFTKKCDKCNGQGFTIEEIKLANPNAQGEMKAKMSKIKGPFVSNNQSDQSAQQQTGQNGQAAQGEQTAQETRAKKDKFNKFKNKNKFKDRQASQPEQIVKSEETSAAQGQQNIEQEAAKNIQPFERKPEQTKAPKHKMHTHKHKGDLQKQDVSKEFAEIIQTEMTQAGGAKEPTAEIQLPQDENKYPAKKVSRKTKKAVKKDVVKENPQSAPGEIENKDKPKTAQKAKQEEDSAAVKE